MAIRSRKIIRLFLGLAVFLTSHDFRRFAANAELDVNDDDQTTTTTTSTAADISPSTSSTPATKNSEKNSPTSVNQASIPTFGVIREEEEQLSGGRRKPARKIVESIVVDLMPSDQNQETAKPKAPEAHLEATTAKVENGEGSDKTSREENSDGTQKLEPTVGDTEAGHSRKMPMSSSEQEMSGNREEIANDETSPIESSTSSPASSSLLSEEEAYSQFLSNDDDLHTDKIEDSFFAPLMSDPSCEVDDGNQAECHAPPESTIETETIIDATCLQGGGDHLENDSDDTDEKNCFGSEDGIE